MLADPVSLDLTVKMIYLVQSFDIFAPKYYIQSHQQSQAQQLITVCVAQPACVDDNWACQWRTLTPTELTHISQNL